LPADAKHLGLIDRNTIHSPSRDSCGYGITPILKTEQEAVLDAAHFRQRAAHAREMAQSGDDLRLSRMLLEVALDMDAEAEAIEASSADQQRAPPRVTLSELREAVLHTIGPDADTTPARVTGLSVSGARFRVDRSPSLGSRVILELSSRGLRLDGTISRVHGMQAAMVFDPATSADPCLGWLLGTENLADRVKA